MKFSALARVRNLLGAAVLVALIFLPAGRFDYWQGWLFLTLSLGFAGLSEWLLKDKSDLLDERFHPGKGMKWWDKGYWLLSTPLYFAAISMAAFDAGRDAWLPHPGPALYFPALAIFLAGQGLYLWAKGVNPFFSSVARIQTDRGQVVCRDGPYRFCRHPGYLGGLLFGLTTPIVLGSYWALIPQVLAGLLLVVRTLLEDRMLTRDLLWYAEYKQAVSSLLVPGLF